VTAALPFSRPIKVETLPRDGLEQAIEAAPAERAALAEANGLVDISELKATFLVKRAGKGARVVGTLHAEITQTCVVSLEPFPATIDEPVDMRFAPPPARERPSGQGEPVVIDLDGDDPPDPIVDGKIDLGAIATEFLALALDPYPRKPGVEFSPPPEEAALDTPFVALAAIVKKGE
jgi:uncharacterized metal-binding protein YceD (DUF177 family)